jgi:Na+/H+ antiporter NhaC
MEPYAAQWLSILPPIVAIGLALITKEVFSALLVGIFSGTLIYACGTGANIVMGTVETAFKMMSNKLDLNIIIFCSLLGALVHVMSLSGGTIAYGRRAATLIKGRKSSLMATSGLGFSIFIDDYFNCLTVGTVMRPLTDLYKVSRAKLAYIIDSTSAPICIIAPVSSWAAAVGSSLKDTGAFDSAFGAFIATIPWNFYALLSLVMVLFICFTDFDFGPMRKAEQAARLAQPAAADTGKEESLKYNPNGTSWDMLLPLFVLIVAAVLALMWTGGYWGTDAKYQTFAASIGNASASIALVLASFCALIVAFLLYVPRRLVSFNEFVSGVIEGIKLMLPANLILILAWTLSGVCRDLLSTPQFVQHLVTTSGMSAMFLPAIIFGVAAALSFSTGTAWGTFGILIPIVTAIFAADDPLLVVGMSACLAGAVCGDHISPISDTTVMASAGANVNHIEHVSTQLPYALTVAAISFACFIVAGVVQNWIICLAIGVVLTIGVLLVLRNTVGKKSIADRKEA